MPLTSLECQVSELLSSGTRPRPTTHHRAAALHDTEAVHVRDAPLRADDAVRGRGQERLAEGHDARAPGHLDAGTRHDWPILIDVDSWHSKLDRVIGCL